MLSIELQLNLRAIKIWYSRHYVHSKLPKDQITKGFLIERHLVETGVGEMKHLNQTLIF